MWYVYFLENRGQNYLYTGSTGILKRRLEQHSAGESLAVLFESNPQLLALYGEVNSGWYSGSNSLRSFLIRSH